MVSSWTHPRLPRSSNIVNCTTCWHLPSETIHKSSILMKPYVLAEKCNIFVCKATLEPLVPLRCLLGVSWVPRGCLLGASWVPLGWLLGAYWVHWMSLWVPLGCIRRPWFLIQTSVSMILLQRFVLLHASHMIPFPCFLSHDSFCMIPPLWLYLLHDSLSMIASAWFLLHDSFPMCQAHTKIFLFGVSRWGPFSYILTLVTVA